MNAPQCSTGWDAFDAGMHMGFCMIPGIPGTKKPYVSWKAYQSGQRPTDTDVIMWRKKYPMINPLVITGRASGIIVLDQDGVEGFRTRAPLGSMPRTVTVQTPRGVFHEHYWFRYPLDLGRIHNFVSGYSEDLPHLDLRGDGGLAVFPGGTNGEGTPYTFLEGRAPHEVPIADLTECEWLYNYIKAHNTMLSTQEAERQAQRDEAERLATLRANSVVLRVRQANSRNDYSARMARYADAARRRQLAKIAECDTGGRNNQLNRSAYALAAFLNEGVWTELELERDLERAAVEAGLDKDPNCGISGIRSTIASGLRAGRRNRVTLPDRQERQAS